MGVELMTYASSQGMKKETAAMREAVSAGIKSMEHLVRLLSQHQHHHHHHHHLGDESADCKDVTEATVSNFNTLITSLTRTGRARFRRGPSNSNPNYNLASQMQQKPSVSALDFTNSFDNNAKNKNVSSSSSSFFMSTITGDGTVSGGKGLGLFNSPVSCSGSGKPPLPKKRCRDHVDSDDLSGKVSTSGRCHCSSSKERKLRVKKTIRVPAPSSKTADIPMDEYSWRKYGQKPIKGSPYPRGYYRCTRDRECPARKHVERASDEPNMLIVTYKGNHLHGIN